MTGNRRMTWGRALAFYRRSFLSREPCLLPTVSCLEFVRVGSCGPLFPIPFFFPILMSP